MKLAVLEDNMMVALPLIELARQQGFEVEVWNTATEALARLTSDTPTHLVMAMRLADPDLVNLLKDRARVAAYGPHVDGSRFQELRRWGVRDVWPNSRLPDKYPKWLSGAES